MILPSTPPPIYIYIYGLSIAMFDDQKVFCQLLAVLFAFLGRKHEKIYIAHNISPKVPQ
jgi:DNA polymerase III epsilon subunit-like protein